MAVATTTTRDDTITRQDAVTWCGAVKINAAIDFGDGLRNQLDGALAMPAFVGGRFTKRILSLVQIVASCRHIWLVKRRCRNRSYRNCDDGSQQNCRELIDFHLSLLVHLSAKIIGS